MPFLCSFFSFAGMNEFYSHTVSVICIFLLLALPVLYNTNFLWIPGVVAILVLMFIRAAREETTRKTEWLFITMNLIVLTLTFLLAMI
jgi:4-hydroxybenzoate polyprenyltransferase